MNNSNSDASSDFSLPSDLPSKRLKLEHASDMTPLLESLLHSTTENEKQVLETVKRVARLCQHISPLQAKELLEPLRNISKASARAVDLGLLPRHGTPIST